MVILLHQNHHLSHLVGHRHQQTKFPHTEATLPAGRD